MTIAELHGKLAPDRPSGVHERIEDLLTSDVFGTMKYAGWEYGFLDWLLQAQPAPIAPVPPPISTYLAADGVKYVDYAFWPTLSNNREPDVALLFGFEEAEPVLILVETKYFSGTSDWEGDEDSNPYGITGNQIADQVRGLKQMTAQDLASWFKSAPALRDLSASHRIQRLHLFVTMHTVLPRQDYELSKRKLGPHWPIPAHWLSWTSLAGCLRDNLHQSDWRLAELIGDLYRLLRRKGLVPFKGFTMEPWEGTSSTSSFWRENWWSFTPLALGAYRSFWDKTQERCR
jgi:hypothetical protein